ncbi:phosphoribosylanthranilate isomerase [Alcaligenaceae bacterium LF4-65]|jgi:phosphoribosylanthranilate isomerase|uniref:N-(5'-phosphoribosyl)anthranilate isomerase n=1 Tax=Zwartia hollandica TaxID=324606 RepID=A0A953N7S4_9BURK|nr:phosphoribosylanthranilate isomerase [Zwartia hollandica]MBZ1349148.1 phosphoribosylanthranilate isomerase [Zwartia hollandica]
MSNNKRTRIKICGITREEDLLCAVAAGADALGFVFHPSSKRCVSPSRASELCAALPPFVTSVALFVNPERSFVNEVINKMSPSTLQFHGDEAPDFCSSFGRPYLKAFRVGAPGLDTSAGLALRCADYGSACGWLFDSYSPLFGGSGHGFDHGLLGGVKQLREAQPIILSGGLSALNVQAAIEATHPWAVDVSSGVESSPGIKSAEKMLEFVSAVSKARLKIAF